MVSRARVYDGAASKHFFLAGEEDMAVRRLLRDGLVLGVVMLGVSASGAVAGDWFIVTGLEKSQADAQEAAATSGAWVLDTDLYPKLPAGQFAVVHGPYGSVAEAKAELSFLQSEGELGDAHVREGGECRLPLHLGGGTVPRAVFTALLGELTVAVQDRPGSTSPCEPQEPYQRVDVGIMNLGPTKTEGDAATLKAIEVPLPLGGFFVIKRTGEIQRLRICME
jgi:hypothetical protein